MTKQKGNVVVIAIIIVIVAITVAIFTWSFAKKTQVPVQQTVANQPTSSVTQTQPVTPPAGETASWQTYSNVKLGFSLKYPTGYETLLGDPKTDQPDFYIKNPQKDINPKKLLSLERFAFELSIARNNIGEDGDMKNPEEWYQFQKSIDENKDRLKKTTINGNPAYYYEENIEKSLDLTGYTVFVKKGKSYDTYFIHIKKNDVGEKIISTLEFL